MPARDGMPACWKAVSGVKAGSFPLEIFLYSRVPLLRDGCPTRKCIPNNPAPKMHANTSNPIPTACTICVLISECRDAPVVADLPPDDLPGRAGVKRPQARSLNANPWCFFCYPSSAFAHIITAHIRQVSPLATQAQRTSVGSSPVTVSFDRVGWEESDRIRLVSK